MNRHILRGKLRELRGGLTREWGKLTHNDLRKIEGELDRIVGLFEKRYGYTSERAVNELERYVQNYGERTRNVMNEQLEQLRKQPQGILPLVSAAVVAVGLVVLMIRFRTHNN
ncbi:MAG: hypothetical protein R2867_36025 [Caldilineaceae bacterium]